MERKSASPRPPKFYFVRSSDLDCVGLDEDERTPQASTLLELLLPEVADTLLATLRRTLSLTYFTEASRSVEDLVSEIRRKAIKTLGELGEHLEALRLKRVDADKSFVRNWGAKVHKYSIVASREMRRRVAVEGSSALTPLAQLIQHCPADPAIRALRSILELTFREATTPTQCDQILEEIRFLAAAALAPCNEMLEEIEIEPVAMPTLRRFVDGVDTYADADASPAEEVLP